MLPARILACVYRQRCCWKISWVEKFVNDENNANYHPMEITHYNMVMHMCLINTMFQQRHDCVLGLISGNYFHLIAVKMFLKLNPIAT